MVLIADTVFIKRGIFPGPSEGTPTNEFSSTNASETVSTNFGIKLANTNYFLIIQNKINFNFNFANKNKGNGNCNGDFDLSKADSYLDFITDEDVKAVS